MTLQLDTPCCEVPYRVSRIHRCRNKLLIHVHGQKVDFALPPSSETCRNYSSTNSCFAKWI